jgi:glycosyltransferase involved in cell wall biosynthesis
MLAMPSAREGYGITVVEGQAAGAVPIVARGPLSAASELVEPGVDGLVVDGTVEALAAAIADLLDHPASLDRLAKAARSTGARRGWDERAAELEQVYGRLVASPRSGRATAADGGRPAEARNWSAGA